MNTPNKISLLRLIMAFVAIAIFGIMIMNGDNIFYGWVIFGLLFTIASFTDFLDGYLARKNNQVTTFGKFIDPISDKILINSTLLMLSVYQVTIGNGWLWLIATVMIIRDISVDASRMLCAKEGKVVAASVWGKIKTISQMVGLIVLIVGYTLLAKGGFTDMANNIEIIGMWLMFVACLASVWSGAKYLAKSRDIIFKTM